METEPSRSDIDELIAQFVSTAEDIRVAINAMDDKRRRSRSTDTRFSNQFELDVVADQIVHKNLSGCEGYILSEEREVDKTQLEENQLVLVVDPVDGSTNASRNLNYWSFSAAIIFNGQVIGAVVVDQTSPRIFRATHFDGASIEFGDGMRIPLGPSSEEYEVGSAVDNFVHSVICFHTHGNTEITFRHLRHFGSSALAICDVARGGFDAYIDDEEMMLKPWDLLAAEYIAKRAGCHVLRRDSEGLLAATGVLATRSDSLLTQFEPLFPHFFR